MTTPWSTDVDHVTVPIGDDMVHLVRVDLMLSLDRGPMREFRSFLEFDLDEGHATELLGKLTIALRKLRQAKEAAACPTQNS